MLLPSDPKSLKPLMIASVRTCQFSPAKGFNRNNIALAFIKSPASAIATI